MCWFRLVHSKKFGFSSIDENNKRSFGYEPLECSYFDTPCSFDHDLDWYFDSDFGNCFKFNPSQFKNGSRREVYEIGMPFSGLEMTMFLGVPDDRKAYLFERESTVS